MNLLQNLHLAVIEYLYRGRRAVPLQTITARHIVIVIVHSYGFVNHFYAMRPGNYQISEILPISNIGKITQNKGHFAVQGNSRSPILVPIKSSYCIRLLSSYQDDS